MITRGAGVLVITGGVVRTVHTTDLWITWVICARIAIVARHWVPRLTSRRRAGVTQCTGVTILTRSLIGNIQTARTGHTTVVRTWVVVVAKNGLSVATLPVSTMCV